MVIPRAPTANGVPLVALPDPDSSPDQLMATVVAPGALAAVTVTVYAAAEVVPVYWLLLLFASGFEAPGTQALVPGMWNCCTAMVPFQPAPPPVLSAQLAALTAAVSVPTLTPLSAHSVAARPVLHRSPRANAVVWLAAC